MSDMRPDIVHTHPYIDKWRAKGFQYYVVPKAMLRSGYKFGLGSDEVVLYVILRDRVSLSFENKWIDEQGRIYIIFTREEASRLCGWSLRKTVDVFARLVEAGLLTEVEQTSQSSVLKKPKRLYVRQWVEPSVYMPLETLKQGGFLYMTEDTVFADQGEYYILPKCLLDDPIYEGLNLRAILVYMLALDQLHLSIKFGRVDEHGLVWCYLNSEQTAARLGCSLNSITKAYRDLSEIGLMTKVRNGSNAKTQWRFYLRDYLPPPKLEQTQISPSQPCPDAKNTGQQNLHPGNANSAPGGTGFCTRDQKVLHPGDTSFASYGAQSLHPIQPSYPPESTPSLTESNIGAGCADVPEESVEIDTLEQLQQAMRRQQSLAIQAVRRQIEYEALRQDIQLCMPEEDRSSALRLLDRSIEQMVADAMNPAEMVRLGNKFEKKADILLAYRDLDRYILYTMLSKVAPRVASLQNEGLYLHNALIHAVENHEAEAYFTKKKIAKKRQELTPISSPWPW